MSYELLTALDAQRIADIFLAAIQSGITQPLVFVGEPVEFVGGWLYLYDTERHVRTGDISAALGGNGPIAVFSRGRVELLDTASSVEKHVERLNAAAT